MQPRRRQPIPDRFWRYVEKVPFTTCWLWSGPVRTTGYGVLNLRERGFIGAHRLSYELNVGPIPDDVLVCHHCDQPLCVNPEHLYLGDKVRNAQDAVDRGRFPDRRGDKNNVTKLTADQVREMRLAYAGGNTTHRALAIRYGIHRGTVAKILGGRAWTNV